MIVEHLKGRTVLIRYRDENRNRKELKVKDIKPFCYVEDESAKWIEATEKESGYTGLYGESLTKITVPYAGQIREIRDTGKTWEANIPFTNRVLTERINRGDEKIENYDHRIWYLDAEWCPESKKMRIITIIDSYTGNEYNLYVAPSQSCAVRRVDGSNVTGKHAPTEFFCENHPEGHEIVTFPARGFKDEKSMLESFMRLMQKQDPDIITGWFVVGADIKTIAERCRACGLSPAFMSPLRKFRYDFGDWEQPIPGRMCIDLMIAFSKLWELKNGKMAGYRLDDAAQMALGDSKIELENGHDTYFTDFGTYMDYARKDTALLPRLNERVNAIEYFLAIQHIVQCDIKSTPFVTKVFTCLALTDSNFQLKIPTKPQFDKVAYQGADVMVVEPGIYDSIGIMDIKAMYHSNASKYGISWDTLDPEGEDCGNGVKFNRKEKGLLVRQMDAMTHLRNHYKWMMKNYPDERDKWDTMQFACKSLVASMYGVAGDAKFGLYHPEVAAAITHTSRNTLNQLKEICEEAGCEVIYGHTDSVFVKMESPEQGVELNAHVNKEMAPIECEFEKHCTRMVLMAKNRYAGRVTWTDGEYHDPKIYVKGIELKQSRMPQVMKDAMGATIEGILNGDNEGKVTDNLTELITRVVGGEMPVDELTMKGKLEKNLGEYRVLSGSSAAADWANKNLGKGYRKGSFFRVTIDDNGKYIAFDKSSEIEGITTIGHRILAERFIVKKIEPYYSIAGWDLQPIHNALNGLGDLGWI